jgi:hypothetical protein
MVYTQVEITPKSPENDMKKQGSELLPQKTTNQVYTRRYTGIHSRDSHGFAGEVLDVPADPYLFQGIQPTHVLVCAQKGLFFELFMDCDSKNKRDKSSQAYRQMPRHHKLQRLNLPSGLHEISFPSISALDQH